MVPARGPQAQTQSGFLLFFLPENEPPSPLVSGIIDYNMPLTSTYLKQMKLRVMNSQEQVRGPRPLAGPRSVITRLDVVGSFQGVGPRRVFTHWESKRPLSGDLGLALQAEGRERMCPWLGGLPG